LTFSEFLAVRRGLLAGLRHVEIARELDLGVWTVDRIAARLRYENDPAAAELPEDDAPPDYAAAKLRRCPGCGAMVYVWPCIACQMATMTRVAPAAEVGDEPEEADERPNYKQRLRRKRLIEVRVFGKAG
jgi:hypothetical protein